MHKDKDGRARLFHSSEGGCDALPAKKKLVNMDINNAGLKFVRKSALQIIINNKIKGRKCTLLDLRDTHNEFL